MATTVVWLLFGASVFLDVEWRRPDNLRLSVSVEWGGVRVYWVDSDPDDSWSSRPSFVVRSSSLLWNIRNEFNAIKWRYVLLPTFEFGGLFGNSVDINLPLWIPATALLTLFLYVRRRDSRRRSPTSCATCGYDLTGNTSGRCPECGSPTVGSAGMAR